MAKAHPIQSASLIAMSALSFASIASAFAPTGYFPANGATGVCTDVQPRLTFSVQPKMAWGGAVRIRNVATNTVVKTWTFSGTPTDPSTTAVSNWSWTDSVGSTLRNIWPVVVDSVPEHVAQIRIPIHLLAASTKYQIEMDAGVLTDAGGSTFSGVASGAWVFTTGAKPSTKSTVTVADDGTADACTIQGGLEHLTSGSSSAVTLKVQAGTYREMVNISSRQHLRLYGEGSTRTLVRYYNCEKLNSGTSVRSVVHIAGGDVQIRAISITNTITATGNDQAEALYLQGDSSVVADVHIHSYQDTWLNSAGRAYIQNSVLDGSVDFVWGYYPAFFKNCTLTVNRAGGVILQPRNGPSTHGYVFDSCLIQPYSSSTKASVFARDGGSGYSYGEAVFLHSILKGSPLTDSGWMIDGGADTSKLRFCEYLSRDGSGNLLTFTNTLRKRFQCPSDTAAAHAKVATVLSGWTPSFPTLASILGATSVLPSENSSLAQPKLSIVSDGGNRYHLEIPSGGVYRVREIRADGSMRTLADGRGKGRADWSEIGSGISWIELESEGIHQTLPLLH
jgi:pectinesterase